MKTAYQEKCYLLGLLHEASAHSHLGDVGSALECLNKAIAQVEIVYSSTTQRALEVAADRYVKAEFGCDTYGDCALMIRNLRNNPEQLMKEMEK